MAIAHSKSHPEKAFFLNQHGNLNDGLAHEQTTGKELWDQTEGRLNSVVIGLGTSGTFDGLSKFLKYKNPNIKIIAYEPASSPVYSGGKQGKYTHTGVGPGFLHDCVATPAAKLEMFDPMSVKGRPALYMIEEAERNGLINKDTTIIEASRGYTGVALTFICSVPFLLIQGRDIFPYKVFFKIGVFKVRYFCLGNLISSS